MSIHGSQHKRTDAELATGAGVDLSSVSKQQLNDVHIAS